MLKYQYQVPTRWLSWQVFKKQSQCHMLGHQDIFNAMLPSPQQIDVLYINLNGLNECNKDNLDMKDQRYHLHSWLGFLMWYANQVKYCLNPLKHGVFSPGVWSKTNIRRQAHLCGLSVSEHRRKRTEVICSILGNQIITDDSTFLRTLGHERIKSSFKLFNMLELRFGQLFYDESGALCKLSQSIQYQISVPVIIKACQYMLSKLSYYGFQYLHVLNTNDGWTIGSKERPKIM